MATGKTPPRSIAENRPASPVTPEVAGSSPVAPAPLLEQALQPHGLCRLWGARYAASEASSVSKYASRRISTLGAVEGLQQLALADVGAGDQAPVRLIDHRCHAED